MTEQLDPSLQEGESPEAYVARQIDAIFTQLAEELADVEMSEDEAAALPHTLFLKNHALKKAWFKIVEDEQERPCEQTGECWFGQSGYCLLRHCIS